MPDTRATNLPPQPDEVPPELARSAKFEIQAKLGQGGMGAVYKARHTFLNELVAIKVLHAGQVGNAGTRARFLREMLTVGQLRHRNIVRALDAEQMGDALVLVMEYVSGITLDKLVAQRGPLPVDFACRCVVQAAEGLQHAHEKGLVHRDVKPANLIVTAREKEVKLLDFGLARGAFEDSGPTNQTRMHAMLGSPLYMAPEQASNAHGVDIRADVYGLGCTLYFLLAGHAPFVKPALMDVLLAHAQEAPRPLTDLRKDVPPGLWAVVARMLAKNPADRFQTPAEVVQALRPHAAIAPAAAPKPAPPVPVAAPVLPAGPDEGATLALEESAAEVPLAVSRTGGASKRRPAAAKPAEDKKWLIGAAAAAGVLLLAGVGLLAVLTRGGKVKEAASAAAVNEPSAPTPSTAPVPPPREGTLIVEVNEPGTQVLLDGSPAAITWDGDGKRAEIQVEPGARRVDVKKSGFLPHSVAVELAAGDRRVVTVTLQPAAPPATTPPAAKAPVATLPSPGPVAVAPPRPAQPTPNSAAGAPGPHGRGHRERQGGLQHRHESVGPDAARHLRPGDTGHPRKPGQAGGACAAPGGRQGGAGCFRAEGTRPVLRPHAPRGDALPGGMRRSPPEALRGLRPGDRLPYQGKELREGEGIRDEQATGHPARGRGDVDAPRGERASGQARPALQREDRLALQSKHLDREAEHPDLSLAQPEGPRRRMDGLLCPLGRREFLPREEPKRNGHLGCQEQLS
jgi:hypothetical protein